MNKLILASGSPRRREILEKNGYKPEIMKMDVDETLPEGISFRDAVMFLSLKKGLAAEEALKSADTNASTDAARPDLSDSNASAADASSGDRFLILSADTVVYKDGILGKPHDDDEAFDMLARIRNTSHYVATGVTLLSSDRKIRRTLCDVTEVICGDYTDEWIREYIATGEPADKAGAYAIQGGFGVNIDHFDGDYENVVGLPFYRIKETLEGFFAE
ncbi:MAG: Maf family protein [Eubacteriales bacterium]|nr:Maf family protein [Eubacteriales bacterium]